MRQHLQQPLLPCNPPFHKPFPLACPLKKNSKKRSCRGDKSFICGQFYTKTINFRQYLSENVGIFDLIYAYDWMGGWLKIVPF